MNEKSQVLVVGAGPTGLTLALYLAKHGINVRIIEQSIDAHGGARGTAISVGVYFLNFVKTAYGQC